MRYAAVLAAMALVGCATPNQSQLSPDQLKAIALQNNFTAVCSKIQGPWGTGSFVYSNVDKTVVVNGEISVDANCVVTMTNAPAPKVTTTTVTTTAPVTSVISPKGP